MGLSDAAYKLRALFGADTTEFKKGAIEVKAGIEDIKKGVKETGVNAEQAGGKIKKGFEAIAKASIYTGAIVGGEFGAVLTKVSAVTLAVGELGSLFGALAASKIAAFSSGIAAVGVAIFLLIQNFDTLKERIAKALVYIFAKVQTFAGYLISLLSKFPLLTDSMRESLEQTGKSLERMGGLYEDALQKINAEEERRALALKAQQEALEAFNKSTSSYLESIRQIEAEERAFGGTKETLNSKIAATRKALIDLEAQGVSPLDDSVALLRGQYDRLVGVMQTAEDIPKIVASPIDDPNKEQSGQGTITFSQEMTEALEALHVTSQKVAEGIVGVFQAVAQGIGDSVANVIIYGADLATTLTNLLKQIGAQIISFLIQLAIQELIYLVAAQIFASSLGGSKVGVYSGIAAAAAAADTIEKLGVIGIPLAPLAGAAAGAAVAGAAAGAGAIGHGVGLGLGAAEKGALVTGPAAFIVGESRIKKPDEVIAPRSQFEDLFKRDAEVQNIYVTVDGKVIARAAVRGAPREIRIAGARTR